MRNSVQEMIHESPLGMEKCKARARAIVHWPGMTRDVHDTVAYCTTYLIHRNQKEPIIPHAIPDRPLQKLGSAEAWSPLRAKIMQKMNLNTQKRFPMGK